MPWASRREVLSALAATAAVPVTASTPIGVRAVAFDAFVLFNTSAIVRRAQDIVGDNAAALVASASAKLFPYTWLYTSAGRYAGFEKLARDAFHAAALATGPALRSFELAHIVNGYSALEPWPDVADGLDELRESGIRLAILSNLPRRALESGLTLSGLSGQFEHVLSTDEVEAFKPARAAYALATSRLQLSPRSIGFAASAGWDAAGATWFGYPTVWVNRSHAPAEAAHALPDVVTPGMEGVLRIARFNKSVSSSARNFPRSSTE